MRIFSKKALQFDHPAGQEPAVTVQHQDFAEVPDWVSASAMFKLASEAGDITVIENKQDELAAEKDDDKAAKAKAAAEAKAKKKAEEEAAKAAAEEDARKKAEEEAHLLSGQTQ